MNAKIQITALSLCVLCAQLAAQSFHWENAGEGLWSDGANWNPQGPPSASSSVYIGNGGTAVLEGSDSAALTYLNLGEGTGESGGLRLQGSAQLSLSQYAYVGYAGNGALELNDDSLISAGKLFYIGKSAGSNSSLTINGGTLKVNGLTAGKDGLWAGCTKDASATLNINGGTLDISGVLTLGEDGGHAEAVIKAGEIIVSDKLFLGATSSTATQHSSYGSLTVDGGTVTLGTGMVVGQGSGTGVNNRSEGSLTINSGGYVVSDGAIAVAYGDYAKGTITINEGGVLETHSIAVGGGQGVPTGAEALLVIDGGTLKAHDNLDQSKFFMRLLDVRIDDKGATIDSNGKTTAIGSSIGGTGKITKTGESFIWLAGSNDFSGGIDVIEGGVVGGSLTGLGTGVVSIYVNAYLDSWVSAVNLGGIDLQGGTLSANRDSAGSYTLNGENFNMDGGVYNLTIESASSFDQIIGDGANFFALNEGTIALSGDIDYSAYYAIFDNFQSGTVGKVSVSGYDSDNWMHHIDSDGTLWFEAIPEPSSCAGIAGALGLLFAALPAVGRKR